VRSQFYELTSSTCSCSYLIPVEAITPPENLGRKADGFTALRAYRVKDLPGLIRLARQVDQEMFTDSVIHQWLDWWMGEGDYDG